MKRIQLMVLAAVFAAASLQAQTAVNGSHQVTNASDVARTDIPVVLPCPKGVTYALVTCGDEEIPCQLDDLDQDGSYDELCFLVDLPAKTSRTYRLAYDSLRSPKTYPARVYTDMLLRNSKVKEKNKHDNFIEAITARGDCADPYHIQHHHGVDFESEYNAIRIYFDKRQTPDVYGKFQKRLELQETQFYTSKEQKAAGYGDDVLWVGNTFGLGAFRGWDGQQPTMIEPVAARTQRIIAYGPLRTIVEVEDKGWQAAKNKPALNMTLRYIQYAGHRDTDVEVYFTKKHVNARHYLFSTGVINVKGSQEFSDHQGLRGCWGSDYPTGDATSSKLETVGLGILIPKQHIISEQPANKDNYGFVVGTDQNSISYKIVYTSANETFGYHNANDWFSFLKQWRQEVEQPVKVTVAKR